MRVSLLMDRVKHGAWPLFNGNAGAPARVSVKKAGESAFKPFTEAFGTRSASKFADVRLRHGDEIAIDSAGGAGYGDPQLRSKERIVHDLDEGFISKESASDRYGLKLVRETVSEA